MARFIGARLVGAIPTLLAVMFVVFISLRLVPGDPVRIMFGLTPPPEAEMERIRDELGLNEPVLTQFAVFAGKALKGDLGNSYLSKQPVARLIKERFPHTVKLALFGTTIAVTLGLMLGTVAAIKRDSWLDALIMSASVLGVSLPQFWVGILMMLLFAVKLKWLPIAGTSSFKHFILPAVTLGLPGAAVLARIVRSGMIDVLETDYVRTARAKGLHSLSVNFRHALRNALMPVITMLGLQLGALLSGAIIVESVFGFSGLGQLAVQAMASRDYPIIQGVVLVGATAYVLVNILVDIAYAVVDPRIRY